MPETHDFVPFDAESGLILAVGLPGTAAELADQRRTWADLGQPAEGPPLWVHLDRTKERAKRWLREESGLSRLIVDSLLAEETRPRAQMIDGGLLVLLRGVNMNPGADPDELNVIRMWLEPKRIITLRAHRFQTIVDLRRRAQRGEAPATLGTFLAAVATGLSMRLGPTVDNLEQLIEALEDSMLEDKIDEGAARAKLGLFRRQAIGYRRYIVPQRDALMGLAINPPALISASEAIELRVAAEQVARVTDALEEVRDRAAVTQEELRARQEARISKTLYLLTIVATIMLPLGFLTGLLGINVGGLPLQTGWGFAIVCVLLLFVGAGEYLFFRWMRWL